MSRYLSWIKRKIFSVLNNVVKKDRKSIFFYPHINCKNDGYDILNRDSDNVLCLLNSMLYDTRFKDYRFYVLYYHHSRLEEYKAYCENFNIRVNFIYANESWKYFNCFSKCKYVFLDNSFDKLFYKGNGQIFICLNYFGGLIKNEFYKWETNGGYKRMLKEQRDMYKLFDYHLSISEICSKFISLDNCLYYPRFLNLGFPRNDIFFRDNSDLRKQIQTHVGFVVKHIITYVPTHRDYENPNKKFYDKNKLKKNRTIFGELTDFEKKLLENVLEETSTLIIAKVHPVQERECISTEASKHIVFYGDLRENINTSLNPLLSISDYMITDYTTAVYDFLYTGRPIIYYFYDYQEYMDSRGFFINPIQSICAGHITYNINELVEAIRELSNHSDPYKEKRELIQGMFIKDLDGNSSERIKDYFFPKEQ